MMGGVVNRGPARAPTPPPSQRKTARRANGDGSGGGGGEGTERDGGRWPVCVHGSSTAASARLGEGGSAAAVSVNMGQRLAARG